MDDERGIRGCVAELLRDGIVVVPDYLAADRLSALREEVEGLLAADRVGSADGASADGPTVVGDPDAAGVARVVDAHLGGEALEALRDEAVPEAIVNGCTDEFYRAGSLTVRAATGPAEPGNYATAGEETFLAMVYLSDLRDVGDGPLAYLEGSHDESAAKRKLGSVLGEVFDVGAGEATFYEAADGTAHTGAAGTLVVADGRGYHRFLPVEDGGSSTVAIAEYGPAGLQALDPDDEGWESEPPEPRADDGGG